MANRSALARCFAFFCIISVTSFMLWFSQESTAFNYGKFLILPYDLKSKETLSSNSTIHNNTRVRKLTLLNTSISSSAVEGKSSHVLTKCYMPEGKHFRRVQIDVSVPNMQDIQHSWKDKNWVQKGGTWMPTLCKPWRQVAIIVPYRNRYQQLKIFLRHIHPILKRQMLHYRVIVVEQNGNTPFNRAMLFNIGFKEALKLGNFRCFVFHDVDLLPENDLNYYGCPRRPRHLSVAVDKFHYKLPYHNIFGGVGAFTKEQFENINGFSNKFWGWGGEDDDLYKRILAAHYTLSRPSMSIGRYTMVKIGHHTAPGDPFRFEKLQTSVKRMFIDGLNSLKYDVLKFQEHELFTQILVNVDPRAV